MKNWKLYKLTKTLRRWITTLYTLQWQLIYNIHCIFTSHNTHKPIFKFANNWTRHENSFQRETAEVQNKKLFALPFPFENLSNGIPLHVISDVCSQCWLADAFLLVSSVKIRFCVDDVYTIITMYFFYLIIQMWWETWLTSY